MSRRTTVVLSVLAAIAVIVFAAPLFTRYRLPTPPEGVRCYTNTVTMPVSPGANGWPGKGFQVCQFVKLRSGEIAAPVLQVVRPNYRGFMGGVRHDPRWISTFAYMGDGQAVLELPVASEIDSHSVLVRRLMNGDETATHPWRVWTFVAVGSGKELVMPPFETMPLFSDSLPPDLLEKNHKAEAFVSQLDR